MGLWGLRLLTLTGESSSDEFWAVLRDSDASRIGHARDFGFSSTIDARDIFSAVAREHEGPYAVDTIPGNTSTSVTVGAPGSVSSAIDTIGDQDWFSVALIQGVSYDVLLTGSGVSPLTTPSLQLYNSGGQLLLTDADGHIPSLIVGGTATYYFAVSGGSATGDYTLSVNTLGGDTIASGLDTNGVLTVNGASVSTAIETASDADWFRIQLVAGQSYVFTVDGTGANPLADPYLEIYASSGLLVALDDDGGPGANSRMQFTATQNGTYYLAARSYDSSSIGGYSISAATGAPQDPLDTLDLGFTFDTTNISVYFATSGQQLGPLGAALRSWTAEERAAVMTALSTIADVTNLTFTQTSSSASADFILSLTDLNPGVLGQTYPDVSRAYIEFAPDGPGWSTLGLQPGGLGYSVIIHEVGHALGLDHPHYDGGDVQVMQGVTSPFNSLGTFLLNQQVFTIMSYNDGWTAGVDGPPQQFDYGYASTPMALDIARLQMLYGADLSRNPGDTVYTLSDTNTHPFYAAIWDTGGIDTISYSGAREVVIDLNPATLLNQIGGGGFVSWARGVYGGYTIADGVVIENATGGSGADHLTGNAANNVLTGGDGGDWLLGLGGSDTLNGGESSDSLDGGAGADTMIGGNGADEYSVEDAGDVVIETGTDGAQDSVGVLNRASYVAPDGIERVNAGPGTTQLFGNALNNTLSVMAMEAISHYIDGGAGADSMRGSVGDDTFIVDNDGDTIQDFGGYDIVESSRTTTALFGIEEIRLVGPALNAFGDNGNETLLGNGLNNALDGRSGADHLYGGAGDDTLTGANGNDVIDGGTGIDRADVSATSSSASWHRNMDGVWTVTSADGVDTVSSVEFLRFNDRDVHLDAASRTFSGDGTSDILFRRNDGIMASWEVTGTTITSAAFLPAAGAEWTPLDSGDFNADGRADVLWRRDDGLIYSWEMNGGSVATVHALAGIGPEWSFLGAGDFNGDLTDDLAWQRNDGVVFIWNMGAGVIQSAGVVAALPAQWEMQGVGDFNGDGRDDFLWRRSDTGQSVIWMMNGSAISSSDATSVQAGLDWTVAGIGDTNGDGYEDIIVRRENDGMVAVWAMNGTTVTSTTNIAAVDPNVWQIQNIGDYNGDGRDDILWRDTAGVVYSWLLNGASVIGAGGLSGVGAEWEIIGGG